MTVVVPHRCAVAVATLLLAQFYFTPTGAAELTAQEEIGKRIYFEGKGNEDAIIAYFGRDRSAMPATLLPCANCHGRDGRGRPEGGVEPPDITWNNLTKQYGHRHPNGRTHAAFDEVSLAEAVRAGIDPAYNALDPTMPLFEMSDRDMAALIAYLKKLGKDLSPGVSKTAIRIGTLVPGPGPFEGFGKTVTGALEAYFSAQNESGGIYGRRIELVVAQRTDDLEETLANLQRLIEEEPVFAFVSGFAAGMEREIFDLLEENDVPNLGPITLMPLPAGINDGSVFLTTASVAEQAQALFAHMANLSNGVLGPIAVVHDGVPNIETVVRAIDRESAARGLPKPFELVIGRGKGVMEQAVAELSRGEVEAVIYLGSDELLAALASITSATSWRPTILVSGPLNSRAAINMPPEFKGKVFTAYPTLPSDRSADGTNELKKLQNKQDLNREHMATQISTFAAAKVLIEGLRRSGRAISREKFVESLEGLSNFNTGLTPAISFGPAKHVGASGAHVIAVDLENNSFEAPVWVELR